MPSFACRVVYQTASLGERRLGQENVRHRPCNHIQTVLASRGLTMGGDDLSEHLITAIDTMLETIS
jgi:hypothetical protein